MIQSYEEHQGYILIYYILYMYEYLNMFMYQHYWGNKPNIGKMNQLHFFLLISSDKKIITIIIQTINLTWL